MVVGALLPLIAANATVDAAAAAPSQSAGDPCTSATPPALHGGYVLPGWSDGAGWSNPDQYESIASGDIDGDGRGELIGRNASNIEIFTWAPAMGKASKAYDPALGQWSQIIPQGTAPTFATADGWWDLSRSSTFRLADLDGKTGDELLVRTPTGLSIYRYVPATRTWSTPITTAVFPDSAGWGQSNPGQYATITTGNVDGKAGDEIIGRGAAGIESWSFAATGSGLTRVDPASTILSNAGGWDHPEYWRTIRTGDVDHDGIDEIVGRGTGGLQVFDLDVATGSWNAGAVYTGWSNGEGWSDEIYYGSITVGDVNADGRDDVVGRSAGGIAAITLTDGWQSVAPPNGFSDAESWNELENATTVQVADVLPAAGMEVIGRADGGVVTYALVDGAWTLQAGVITAFANANGWGTYSQPAPTDSNVQVTPPDYRYSTIRPVTVASGQPQVIIGRDNTGIRTFHADGSSPSSPFPAYTDLKGLPNSIGTPPPDLDTLSPEGRAYWYVNAQAASQEWAGAGPNATILEQFRNVNLHQKWSPLQLALLASMTTTGTGSPFDPGDADLQKAINVPRGTYNSVLQDVADWSGSVGDVYEQMLGSTGMSELVQQAFLANVHYVSDVEAVFDTNPALVALFADLLWGFIAAVGAAAFFVGAGEATIAVVAALGSVIGSGIAGGMAFYDPNGAIAAFGAELDDKLTNQLCGAIQFFERSFDQIVQDYGLLTANDELVDAMNLSAPAFGDITSAMTKSQELWVWQRFGNSRTGSNMWVGWCDVGAGQGNCPWNAGDANTWSAPENPNIVYQVVGESVGSEGTEANCDYDVLGNDENAKLKALDPPGSTFISPRHTDTAARGRPFGGDVSEGGSPVMGNIGIAGWRLGTMRCDGTPIELEGATP